MDTFQLSVGYRSLFPALCLEDMQAVEQLSEEELLELAKDRFDANLAEILRSTGEWHWKIEIRDVAKGIAETLSFGEQMRYERVRGFLLDYYTERYRCPSAQEYGAYRSCYHPTLLTPEVPASCYSDDHMVEVKHFNATLWFTQATDDELQALHDEGYGGGYTADSVAEFIAAFDPQVQAMFDHNDTLPKSVELRGFECHVNEKEAKAWIVQHRPHLLTEKEETIEEIEQKQRG
jgi:hypothetical protein